MGCFVENVEDILEKLFVFYNASNVSQLSEKMNTPQTTISNWKVRNSVSAVKKKCRMLGIYNEIFGDVNTNIQNVTSNPGNMSQNGDVISNNNDLNNIDEALVGIFKRAYNKCINEDTSLNQDKLDELIVYLTKFK